MYCVKVTDDYVTQGTDFVNYALAMSHSKLAIRKAL